MNQRKTISAPAKYFDRLAQYDENASEAFRRIVDEHKIMCDHLSAGYMSKPLDISVFKSPLEVSADMLPNLSKRNVFRVAIVGAVKMMVSRMNRRPKK